MTLQHYVKKPTDSPLKQFPLKPRTFSWLLGHIRIQTDFIFSILKKTRTRRICTVFQFQTFFWTKKNGSMPRDGRLCSIFAWNKKSFSWNNCAYSVVVEVMAQKIVMVMAVVGRLYFIGRDYKEVCGYFIPLIPVDCSRVQSESVTKRNNFRTDRQADIW